MDSSSTPLRYLNKSTFFASVSSESLISPIKEDFNSSDNSKSRVDSVDSGYFSILKSNSSLLNCTCYHDRTQALSNHIETEVESFPTIQENLSRIDILGNLYSSSIYHCVSRILNHLELKDFCKLSSVSKKWREICDQEKKFNINRLNQIKNLKELNKSKKVIFIFILTIIILNLF